MPLVALRIAHFKGILALAGEDMRKHAQKNRITNYFLAVETKWYKKKPIWKEIGAYP